MFQVNLHVECASFHNLSQIIHQFLSAYLIQAPSGKVILIDAGNNGDASTVTNFVRALGINKIDILIGTHPHEDHIGGLDAVKNAFNIGSIYMPEVSNTTKTFEDVLVI